MRSKVISQAAWFVILVVTVSKRGRATLNIKPSDTVVLLNGSAVLNCSTFNFSSSSEEISSKEISWYHYSTGQRKDVYDDGEIRTNYKGRFRVEKDLLKGAINLIVQALTLEDAGTYECQDEKGFGETASAQLIVLETEPICRSNMHPDGVIGSNDCGIPSDQLEMSCSITYRGKNPVQLEWRNGLANDKSSLTVQCSNTTNRSTCNLTVAGNRTRNNSVFICQIKNIGTNAYNCSSNAIKILYAMSDNTTISKTGEELTCSVNSSQQCSYSWNNDGNIVSTSKSLKPAKSGQYVCKANCSMRRQPCLVTAGNFNVSVETTNEETRNSWLIAVVVIVALIVIAAIIVAIVVLLYLYKKWKMKKPPTNKTEETVHFQPNVHTDVVDSAVPYDIQKAFDKHRFISKGLNGEIRGPVQYKDIAVQCAFERIICSTDQRTPANEVEMAKQQKLCSYGKQWMELDHDNLVKFYDVVLKPPVLFIVKEYTAGGSVRNALKECSERKVILQMLVVRDWATQIAQGMNYLHEKNIIHNGLKCAQVQIMELFDPSAAAPVTLKISSYNLTSDIDRSNPATFEGMFAWMAPEAILQSKYSTYSDIWSYGVTVWEILTTELPYNNYKTGQIMTGISSRTLSLKTPDTCPQDLHDIIEECFDEQPERRPAFSKILTRLREVH